MDYKEYFISKWPEEGVGYFKDGEFYPLENIFDGDRRQNFKVDPSFLICSPDVLVHSHTTNCGFDDPNVNPHSPSATDLEYQMVSGIEWGICVTDGETCEDPMYFGDLSHRPPLEGRDFIYGIQDCFTLVQDWFYANRGVELPSMARSQFDEVQSDLLEKNIEKWGFERIDLNEVQVGDVLLYAVRTPHANHLGLYIGDGQVLSHWFGRLSAIEPYGRWASHIKCAARYKGVSE